MAERRMSLWRLVGLTPQALVWRTIHEAQEDDVFGRAAELAYYFLLALFPLMLFVMTVLGMVASGDPSLRANLVSTVTRVMPSSAGGLVQQTVNEIVNNAGGGKAAASVLGALWAAAAGMLALMEILNIVYSVEEHRSWICKRATAIGATAATSVLVIVAIVVVLYGSKIANFVSDHAGLGASGVVAWKVVQWPVMLFFMFVAFSVVYYFGPAIDVKKRRWHWVTPGSVAGMMLWLLASFGFRLYLSFFNSYSKMYGSLATVVILMLWFYLTAMAILIGAEVNYVIENGQAGADVDDERQPRIQDEMRAVQDRARIRRIS